MQGIQWHVSRLGFLKAGAGLAGILLATNATAQVLLYRGTNFTARWQNDGGFNPLQSTIVVTLTNSANNFATNGQDFIALGFITPTNLPSGLTALATRTATNKITLALTGFHTPNSASQNISNLFFTFNDNAFSNNAAGAAEGIAGYNGTNQISVCFLSQLQSNWYVSASGSETNSGTTIGSPFLSITNAIKHAQAIANDVINIAAGTYTISGQPAIAITKNLTFVGASPATTIIQANATPGAATNGIFVYTASNTNAMFVNLTLQNGRAPQGGAIEGGSGTTYTDLIASNCVFINNSATNTFGGAIDHHQNASANCLTLIGCIFSNNVATNIPGENGGAIYVNSDILTLSNCVFTGNIATNSGGAIYAGGGPASFVNTLFMNNTALTNSGGAYYQSSSAAIGIYGCTFASNRATITGGGMLANGITTMTNTTFFGNTCSGNLSAGGEQGGGGFYQTGNPCYIYNSTFFGNTAPSGGAVRVFGSGAIYSSIIASNTATGGFAPDIFSHQQTSATLWATNSLIGVTNGAGGVSSLINAATNTPNAFGNYCGNATTPQNPGLLPLANNGGSMPTCALVPGSVAITHGANPLNLPTDERGPGYPRTINGQTDMGAYERNASFATRVFF